MGIHRHWNVHWAECLGGGMVCLLVDLDYKMLHNFEPVAGAYS